MFQLDTAWANDPTIQRILKIAVGVLVVWALGAVAKRWIRRSVSDTSARYQSVRVVGIASTTAILLIVALTFSSNLGGLAVTLGAASAGIAFALQEVIASFAGWLAITFSGFYKPGDRVQVGGIRGDVIDVGLLRTTVMEMGQWIGGDAYNGRIVRVANSFVFKEPVFNYSADFPWVWDELVIPVRYGSDIDAATDILSRIATDLAGHDAEEANARWPEVVSKYNIEPARVDPIVYMIGNDNWLEFTVRYVVDPRMRRARKDAFWRRLVKDVAKTDGAVQFASATYELVAAPDLRVRLAGAPPPSSAKEAS